MSARLDYRGESYRPALSRETFWHRPVAQGTIDPELESRWEEILKEHLATSPRASSEDGWKYKQRLVHYFPLPSFWASIPETIKAQVKKETRLVSLEDLQTIPVVVTIMPSSRFKLSEVPVRADESGEAGQSVPVWHDDTLAIVEDDLGFLSDEHRQDIFRHRSIDSVKWLPEGHLALYWALGKKAEMLSQSERQPLEVVNLSFSSTVGFCLHKTTGDVYEHGLLNGDHHFVRWLMQVRDFCEQNAYGLREEQFNQLVSLLETPVRHSGYELPKLIAYLNGWRKLPDLPPDLYPPTNLTRDMFVVKKGVVGESSERK